MNMQPIGYRLISSSREVLPVKHSLKSRSVKNTSTSPQLGAWSQGAALEFIPDMYTSIDVSTCRCSGGQHSVSITFRDAWRQWPGWLETVTRTIFNAPLRNRFTNIGIRRRITVYTNFAWLDASMQV